MSKKDLKSVTKNTEKDAKKKVNKSAKSKSKTKEESHENEINPLAELQEAMGLEKDKYLRLFAEFENFKKRTAKERLELYKTANQEVIQALIPVLDDFDRAIQQSENSDITSVIQGVTLIYNKFSDILKTNGLTAAETSKGDLFDAELHEAITQIPVESEEEKGKIVDIIEKGYQLGDRIIRYPKVVVGQ